MPELRPAGVEGLSRSLGTGCCIVTGADRAVLMDGALIDGAPRSMLTRAVRWPETLPVCSESWLSSVGEGGYESSSGSAYCPSRCASCLISIIRRYWPRR